MACFKRTICPIREGKRTWIKRTTAGQKLEYIWAYYKPHMAVALGIILLIVFIGQMIYRR